MSDDWLKEIDKKIMGAVLLDFSAAFDIIDHNQLLKKLKCYDCSTSALNPQYGNLIELSVFFNGSVLMSNI
jgi:hypothetical protein